LLKFGFILFGFAFAPVPGFESKQIEQLVQPGQNLTIDVVLEIQAPSDTITVEYAAPQLMVASESVGVVSLQPAQILALPSLGEKDIFRSLQLMPGISASNESSSGLYVRGGTPDQNLVMLDGFKVYKVDHFFGIFSAFNANAVENMTILKGCFDSKYGGRLSSVVDLAGKTSNRNSLELGGGVSLLSYNGYAIDSQQNRQSRHKAYLSEEKSSRLGPSREGLFFLYISKRNRSVLPADS
jgi:hypothetical protein